MCAAVNLSHRHRVAELMDDPAIAVGKHRLALQGLRRINRISRTAQRIWKTLIQHHQLSNGRFPLRVLDIACGGGDLVITLNKHAQQSHHSIKIDGCDISPTAIEYAQAAAAANNITCEFFHLDVLVDSLPQRYDAITCTLFLHHLANDEIVNLLRRMSQAVRLIIADDLVRSRTGFALAWCGTRFLSRSHIVHVDGPRSVQAALTVEELAELAQQAELDDFQITHHFPQRMQLTWSQRD